MNPIYIFNEDKKVFAYNFKELMKESNMTISKLSEITGFEIITIKKDDLYSFINQIAQL